MGPLIGNPDRRRRLRRALNLALGVTWLVAAVVTHLPGPSISEDPTTQQAVRGVWVTAGETLGQLAGLFGHWVPERVVELLRPLVSDKTVHFGLWLALAVFWSSGRALGRGLTRRDGAVIVAVLSLYAGLSEAAQGVMGRIADGGDLIANLAGALAGTAAVGLAQSRLQRRAPVHSSTASQPHRA